MRRSPLVIVYLTVFLDIFGFGMVLPSLPFFVIERIGTNGTWSGALVAGYSLAQFVGAPVLGRLSDRIGRKPVLVASLFGSACALFATGMAQTLWGMLLARAISGMFAGSIATAQAYVADVTTQENRAKYMGMLGASIGLGFVLGPSTGALIASLRTTAFIAAACALVNMLLALLVLRESLPKELRTDKKKQPRLSLDALRTVMKKADVGLVLAASFFAMLGFVAMETTFPLLGKLNANLDQTWLGLVFTFVGLMMVLVQGGLIGRLTKRFGERVLSIAGSLLMGLALFSMPFAHGLPALFVSVAVLALGSGLSTPSLSTLLSRITAQDEQGGVMGINQSLGALARALGPLIAGPLFDVRPVVPYAMGALLMLLCVVLLRPVAQPASTALTPELSP